MKRREDPFDTNEEALNLRTNMTFRPVSTYMESVIAEVTQVLDHGMIRLVDYMGDQNAIVQAARVSYGKGTTTKLGDRSLLRYLMRSRHSTPFEMCEVKLHVKIPIFVARQWIRHRMANVNEVSGRYSILSREFYIPDPENLAVQSKSNKQGRGEVLTPDESRVILNFMREEAERSYDGYKSLLNDDGEGNPVNDGLPMLARELARMNLSLNFYTEWYWKIDLHNLLHFLSLRNDPHAQYEIRVYAEHIWEMVQGWVPDVAEAFTDYRVGAHTFSRQEMELVKKFLAECGKLNPRHRKDLADEFDIGSPRERKAFWTTLGQL